MSKIVVRYARSMRQIDPASWDRLEPFHICSRHAWLSALEESESIGPAAGIGFMIPLLIDGTTGQLLAAAPGTIKNNTRGEYGPENLWISRAEKAGLGLLPKLQFDIPMTPVCGPRLLTHPAWPRATLCSMLLTAILQNVKAGQHNALTIARLPEDEKKYADPNHFVFSHEISSEWCNDGYTGFEEFTRKLKAPYRYNIRSERKHVHQQGLRIRVLRGREILESHWDSFYSGYQAVCERHASPRLLSRDFFSRLAPFGDDIWLIAAFSGQRMTASSFCIRSKNWLLNRNWSELEHMPDALFEVTMYTPIELAIESGLAGIDCGIWGAHKAARGFKPKAHTNAHWFRDEAVKKMAASIAEKHTAGFLKTLSPQAWENHYFHPEPACSP